jgi:hypothetical protein
VYATLATNPATRHRLWLRDVSNAATAVVEIPTGDPTFSLTHLALSPDGTLVVFNGRIASTATPATSQPIDAVGTFYDLSKFTNDSRQLFYSVRFNDGSYVIKRADVTAAGVVSNPVPMTATYAAGEGLGVDFTLTPDETRFVSLGLINSQLLAFVTTANGSLDDTRLHALPASPQDGVGFSPVISPDGRYAAYPAVLDNGVTGLYSTDLQSPGTALLVAGNTTFPVSHQFAGNSRTLFYALTAGAPAQNDWFRASLDTAASGVAFAPAVGAPAPRNLLAARDGSAVVFDGGSQVYATLGNQFATATPLLTLAGGDTVASLKYANDWSSVLVFGASGNAVTAINPKAPGWSAPLAPLPDFSAGVATTCVAFAGEGC